MNLSTTTIIHEYGTQRVKLFTCKNRNRTKNKFLWVKTSVEYDDKDTLVVILRAAWRTNLAYSTTPVSTLDNLYPWKKTLAKNFQTYFL